MSIQRILKTLQCSKINRYIHLKILINNQQLNKIIVLNLNLKLTKLLSWKPYF